MFIWLRHSASCGSFILNMFICLFTPVLLSTSYTMFDQSIFGWSHEPCYQLISSIASHEFHFLLSFCQYISSGNCVHTLIAPLTCCRYPTYVSLLVLTPTYLITDRQQWPLTTIVSRVVHLMALGWVIVVKGN